MPLKGFNHKKLVFPHMKNLWDVIGNQHRLISVLIVSTILTIAPVGYHIIVLNVPAATIQKAIEVRMLQEYGITIDKNFLSVLWAVIVSCQSIGALLGCLFILPLEKCYGTKKSLFLLNNALMLIGSVFFFFAFYFNTLAMLIIGRLLIGVYTSLGTTLMPMFIQELAPTNIKGALSCFVHIAICGGSSLGAILSIDFILGNKSTWHILLALPVFFCLGQFLLGVLLPDTPNYYLDKGDKNYATRSIRFYYCFQDFDDDVAIQEYQQLVTQIPDQISISKAFKEPKTRKGILMGMVVSFTQVFCGSMATVAYSTAMFTSVSFIKGLVPFMPALGSLFSVLLTLPALRLVETCGRKPLLINTLILCAVANFMLMGFSLLSQSLGGIWSTIGFSIAFFVFGLGYNLGTGPVAYFIPAELVRPEAAGVSLGCAVAMNWFSAMVSTLIYYPLNVQVGGFSYLMFAIPTTISIIVLQKWLPNNGQPQKGPSQNVDLTAHSLPHVGVLRLGKELPSIDMSPHRSTSV